MLSRTNEQIDLEMERAFRELRTHPVGTQEYVKILNVISTLSQMKEDTRPSKVSKDTMFNVGANLVSLLMILKHEQLNVITSRAFSLFRLR